MKENIESGTEWIEDQVDLNLDIDNLRFEIDPVNNLANATTVPRGGFNIQDNSISAAEYAAAIPYTKQYGIRMKNIETNPAGVLTAINSWYNVFCNPLTEKKFIRLCNWKFLVTVLD